MHFASPLFDTHPRLIQLKSLLISLFNGEQIDAIFLKGIEHVISVSLGPAPASLTTDSTSAADMPKIHIRTYTINLHPSGVRIPRISLTPMGPFFDLTLRRHQEADATLMAQALKRPKVAKQDVEKGLGKKKKNIEVDEMGDTRGRIHVGVQDLSGLKGKKMKALRPSKDEAAMDVDDEEGDDSGSDAEVERQPQKKRRRV
jgi:ribosome production factor 2